VLFEAARKTSEIDDAMLSHSVVLKKDRAKQKEWKYKLRRQNSSYPGAKASTSDSCDGIRHRLNSM